MYVDTVDISHRVSNAFSTMYVDTVATKYIHMYTCFCT